MPNRNYVSTEQISPGCKHAHDADATNHAPRNASTPSPNMVIKTVIEKTRQYLSEFAKCLSVRMEKLGAPTARIWIKFHR